jgi:ATP-dependent 26S proteasome regulatory subunit
MADVDVTAASQSWLESIAIDRLSQRTAVFIRSTEDTTRISQTIDVAISGKLAEAFKQEFGYKQVLEYNVLRKELSSLSRGTGGVVLREKIQVPMGKTILSVIDEALHNTAATDLATHKPRESQSAIVVIHWILTKEHAGVVQDMIAAWSQDTVICRNKGTVFVFTTDESLFVEPVRRLCSTDSIPVGSDAEIRARLTAISDQAKALHIKVTERVIQSARGLNIHQSETAALKGMFTKRDFVPEPFKEMKVQILESTGLTYIEPTIGFEDIGSYNTLKTEFNDFVITPLHDPEGTKQYGLGVPRGVILHGPPGVGKTLFSLACAKALGIPMVQLTPADLYRSLVGESEGRVKRLTELIESLAPVVVFIDEIDQLFIKRDQVASTDSGVNRRILNGLLQWLGDPKRGSFVIGATNRVMDMDEAAVRPGRFDEIIYVPYPDEAGREEIFRVQCTRLNSFPMDADINYKELAHMAQLMSGAEIQKWCILAARQAMRAKTKTVTMAHFTSVLEQISIDLEERMIKVRRETEELKHVGNVNIPLMESSTRTLLAELNQLSGNGRAESVTRDLNL